MIETIQNLNYILAIFGIFGFFLIAILFLDLFTKRILGNYIQKFGLYAALALTFFSSVLTLVYSEIFGLIPCGLCWLERVFLCPQALLIVAALFLKDRVVTSIHGIILSSFGLIISLYHHYIQMGGSEFIKCPTSGGECAKRFFFEFGFMTFPLMSAVLFILLILLYLYLIKDRSTN